MVSCDSRISVNTRSYKVFCAQCADLRKQWSVNTIDEGQASEQRNVENAEELEEMWCSVL